MEDDVSEAEWRSIAEGLYEVSSDGRVRRVGRDSAGRAPRRNSELRPRRIWTGYLRVVLSVGDRPRAHYVHRLVAEAFIGPRPEGMQVNHKNGRKDDNRAENLEYLTPSENTRHAHRMGLVNVARGERHMSRTRPDAVVCGERHPHSKLTEGQVAEIRRRYDAGGITHRELAADYGVSGSLISYITTRKTWRHVA